MANRITLDELKSYLWQSAVLLRTNIDAGAYKQYIFPLLFFKRICDVYDEETAHAVAEYGEDISLYPENELHKFIVPKGRHWNDVRQVTEDVGAAIVRAFREIEKANGEKMLGIFGDGSWTNKNRLPDRLLRDLLEHFSSQNLSLENCPEDELGQGYEYLIKKFADDSGHTAQEFYTNRTVVHLMTELLQPQSGESVYDPTCGSAGMLISCIAHLKALGKEWRNLEVYGQEINQLTCAIGRMNLFLHGIEDFHIVNDDTLKNPAFIEKGKLKQFDLVLANPPYSISQWDRSAFENDKYGRNDYGTPPQSRADYAFIQHVIASLDEKKGRAAILLPHGVLNRNEEKTIRKAIVQSDCIEAVIGLGRHLFYNSGLESCIVILRKNKARSNRNSVLFVEAEKCTHKVQSQNYLFDDDIAKITNAFFSGEDIPNFSKRVSTEEILKNDGNLNIKLYVNSDVDADEGEFTDNLDAYLSAAASAREQYSTFDEKMAAGAEGNFAVSFDGFDKTNWKRVKLSDVATEYSARIDDPANSEYEWYIGSDCIDGFSFTVSRRQPSSAIHSAQKLFKSGDYLLVRRSLYGSDFRERAPRADFDGICSADILTLREIPGRIADGYLIAVLYSKQLWQFIVSNSTGSLTRRIKWNQLKDFEFELPPIEQQERVVKLLWAMERAKTAYKALIQKTDELVKSQFIEMFGDPVTNPNRWPECKVQDVMIGKVSNGFFAKPTDYSPDGNAGIICVGDVVNRKYSNTVCLKRANATDADYIKFSVHYGDALFCRSSLVKEGIGKASIVPPSVPQDVLFECHVIRVQLDTTKVLPEFFQSFTTTEFFRQQMMDKSKTATMTTIGQKDIISAKVYVPDMALQRQFVALSDHTDKSKFEAQQTLNYLTAAQKALMQQHLCGC